MSTEREELLEQSQRDLARIDKVREFNFALSLFFMGSFMLAGILVGWFGDEVDEMIVYKVFQMLVWIIMVIVAATNMWIVRQARKVYKRYGSDV